MATREIIGKQHIVYLAILVQLAVCVNLFYYQGFIPGSDDNSYLLGAYRVANAESLIQEGDAPQQILAFTRIVPICLFSLDFGCMDGRLLLIYGAGIVFHIALMLLTYVIGVMYFDKQIGILSCLFMAINPLIVVRAASTGSLDLMVAFFCTCSLVLLSIVYLYKNKLHNRRWLILLLYFGAGFLVGMGSACKSTALVVLVPAFLFVCCSSDRFVSWQSIAGNFVLGCGLLTWLGIEFFLLSFLSDNMVIRYTLLGLAKNQYANDFTFADVITGFIKKVREILPLSSLIALLAMTAAPFMKNVNKLLWFWPVWFVSYLTFGTLSLTEYTPPYVQFRYYIPALPVITLISVYMAKKLIDKLRVLSYGWMSICSKLPNLTIVILCSMFALDIYINLPMAGYLGRASQRTSFLETLEKVKFKHPDLPILLSNNISDRMLGLFLKDKYGVLLRNKYFHHYKDPVPEPPFVLIHDGDLYRSRKELMDEKMPGYKAELIAQILPKPSRWYAFRLGNYPVRQNLSKFHERNYYRSTVASLITKKHD